MESEDLKNVFLTVLTVKIIYIEHTSLIVLDIITCLAYVGL